MLESAIPSRSTNLTIAVSAADQFFIFTVLTKLFQLKQVIGISARALRVRKDISQLQRLLEENKEELKLKDEQEAAVVKNISFEEAANSVTRIEALSPALFDAQPLLMALTLRLKSMCSKMN